MLLLLFSHSLVATMRIIVVVVVVVLTLAHRYNAVRGPRTVEEGGIACFVQGRLIGPALVAKRVPTDHKRSKRSKMAGSFRTKKKLMLSFFF